MPRAWSLTLAVLLSLPIASFVPAPASAASVDTVGTIPVPQPSNGAYPGIVGSAAVYYNGANYVFGGRLADGKYSEAIYKHDPATNQVTQVSSFPTETGATQAGRQSGAAVVIGDTVYYFGGAVIVCVQLQPPPADCSAVPKASKSIYAWKPAQPDTPPSLVAQLPDGLWGMEAVAIGGKAYLFGGFTFDVTNPNDIARRDWIIKFDPQGTLGPTAVKLDPILPYAEQDGAAAIVGGSVYVIGGLANNDNNTNQCPHNYRYNATTGGKDDIGPATVCAADGIVGITINTAGDAIVRGVVAHLPYRGQFLTAATVGGKVYVPGARLQSGDASDKIVEFTPGSIQATVRVLLPTLPSGFFAAPASTDGTRVWLFGGRAASLTDMSNNVTLIYPGPTVAWAPRALLARPGNAQVTLTWNSPAYDGDSPVTGYRIYRAADGGAETFVDTTSQLTYVDSAAKPGVVYDYRITSVNAKGESASATANTLSSAIPPGPPSSFTAQGGDGEVLLSWTPPTDDGGSNVTGYRVYVNDTAHPAYSVTAQTREYLVKDLIDGVAYAFTVSAVNSKGEGALSDTLNATPKAVPAPPATVSAHSDSNNHVTIVWEPTPGVVKSFVIMRGTTPTALATLTTVSSSTTQFLDTAAEAGHTYYYAVAAQNDIGTGVRSELAKVSLVTKPSPPQNLFAAPLEGALRITWQAPADPGVLDTSILTYTVVRDGQRIATDISGNSYLDKPLLGGQAHAYSVIATNGIESDPSAPVTGTALAVVNKPPIAVLAILQSVVKANDTVTLDASQSSAPSGSIVEYDWDFGDGSPAQHGATANVTHVYDANGTYTVRVTVKDNRGLASAPAKGTVIVGEPDATTPPPNGADLSPPPTTNQVGTKKSPGVDAIVVVGAAGLLALALRRRK